jgi:Na+-driven multidrug efflux pump
LRSGLSNQIFKWTIPIFLESTLFCLLTMVTSRIEISFGAYAIAMSRVGSQIESLTWLVGAGFGAALTVFVGQNFGAGKDERIVTVVRHATYVMLGWGALVTAVLALGGGVIFDIFLPDSGLRGMGIQYLRILSICQIPMCLENVFSNAFKGKGRTVSPSICNITSNIIRVPMAFILSRTSLGLMGVWIAITATACLRSLSITIWYLLAERKRKHAKNKL